MSATASVCLCTYNRAALLGRALDRLKRLETGGVFTYDIVVVDDASTDDTAAVVREHAARAPIPVRYVRAAGDGIAAARNRCLREATGEWIAFVDDDELVEPDWLRRLFALAAEKDARCVAGAVRLRTLDDSPIALALDCRRILGESPLADAPVRCGRKTYPGAGNVLFHRLLCDTVGVFDETLVWGGEDTDFFRRVRLAGFAAWYEPRAVVHHLIPAHRLTDAYFYWRSLEIGVSFADNDCREWGRGRTLLACGARLAQALIIHLPGLVLAWARGDRRAAQGRRCRLWRAVAYARQTLRLLAPRLCAQEAWFRRLHFRDERVRFKAKP